MRECISMGMATMDAGKSIFFGRPLVEAARSESAQDCIGVSFGRSFNNYHPAYNRFFIPYMEHMKNNDKRTAYTCPVLLDLVTMLHFHNFCGKPQTSQIAPFISKLEHFRREN